MSATAFLAILLGLAPFQSGGPTELGKWWKNSVIAGELGLSEAQVRDIETIFLQHRPALAEHSQELQTQEKALKALWDMPRPDETKVAAQSDAVVAARGRLEKANTIMMLAIRRVLSFEQWTKLQDIRERRTSAPSPKPLPVPKPAPSAGDKTVYKAGGDVIAPRLLEKPLPAYTKQAKEAGVQGIVLLEVVVLHDGSVESVKVKQPLGYGLDEAAVDTVRDRWRFAPGTLHGRPVDVRATIEISFRLK